MNTTFLKTRSYRSYRSASVIILSEEVNSLGHCHASRMYSTGLLHPPFSILRKTFSLRLSFFFVLFLFPPFFDLVFLLLLLLVLLSPEQLAAAPPRNLSTVRDHSHVSQKVDVQLGTQLAVVYSFGDRGRGGWWAGRRAGRPKRGSGEASPKDCQAGCSAATFPRIAITPRR